MFTCVQQRQSAIVEAAEKRRDKHVTTHNDAGSADIVAGNCPTMRKCRHRSRGDTAVMRYCYDRGVHALYRIARLPEHHPITPGGRSVLMLGVGVDRLPPQACFASAPLPDDTNLTRLSISGVTLLCFVFTIFETWQQQSDLVYHGSPQDLLDPNMAKLRRLILRNSLPCLMKSTPSADAEPCLQFLHERLHSHLGV